MDDMENFYIVWLRKQWGTIILSHQVKPQRGLSVDGLETSALTAWWCWLCSEWEQKWRTEWSHNEYCENGDNVRLSAQYKNVKIIQDIPTRWVDNNSSNEHLSTGISSIMDMTFEEQNDTEHRQASTSVVYLFYIMYMYSDLSTQTHPWIS